MTIRQVNISGQVKEKLGTEIDGMFIAKERKQWYAYDPKTGVQINELGFSKKSDAIDYAKLCSMNGIVWRLMRRNEDDQVIITEVDLRVMATIEGVIHDASR